MTDSALAGSPDSQLVRVIGTRQLTASIINTTIGAGIFVLPASVAAGLGPAAPLAYLACGALMTLIVLCFAAAGSRVSLTGGLYAYIEAAYGGYAGFLGGVLYWSTACFSVASVATAFAGSIGVLWPAFGAGTARALVLALLFAGLAVVNIRGIKPGIRLVEAITAAKLLPLLLLIGVGAWAVNPEYLKMSMPTVSQVGQASIVLIFAFLGIEVALMPSGEVRDPARTVPRAVLTALAFTTLVYLAIQGVAQGVLGAELREPCRCAPCRNRTAPAWQRRKNARARGRNDFDVRIRGRRHARYAACLVRPRPRRRTSGDSREGASHLSHTSRGDRGLRGRRGGAGDVQHVRAAGRAGKRVGVAAISAVRGGVV